MEYSDLSNEQIVDRIESGAAIIELENSEGWKLVSEAMSRLVTQAQNELISADASKTMDIVYLQTIIKLYRDVVPGIVKSMKEEAKVSLSEAKIRRLF